ncbi:hypothetical protein Tco_1432327, partial [Tanacetum coccineum]
SLARCVEVRWVLFAKEVKGVEVAVWWWKGGDKVLYLECKVFTWSLRVQGGDKVLYLECKVFTWSLRVQGGDKEVKEASKAVTR